MANDFGVYSLAKQYGAATDVALGQQKLSTIAGEVQRGEALRQSLSNLFEQNPNAGPGDAAGIALEHGEMGVAAQLYNADAALGKLNASSKMDTRATKLQRRRGEYMTQLGITEDPAERQQLQTNISELTGILNKMRRSTGRTKYDVPGALDRELKSQDLRDTIAIKQIKKTMAAVRQNPSAVGVWGSLVENIGGLVGQIPGGVGEMLNEGLGMSDITKVRTALYTLVGPLIPRITGDTSGRYSDKDMERVTQAYAALKYANSAEQALASMETIMDTIATAQTVTRGTYPHIIPQKESDDWVRRAMKANPGSTKDEIIKYGRSIGKAR